MKVESFVDINTVSQLITKYHVRERMHFVNQIVPEDVTDISTIKDMLEQYEEEEEEEEMLKSKVAEQLFTPHPRFPCLSETVSC